MRLLLDSDIFCKLGIAGLLDEALRLLGGTRAEAGRLPALPFMLRRGRLIKAFGAAHCAALVSHSEAVAECPAASAAWLAPLAGVPDMDPGEALLLAAAAEHGLVLLSGDKRSLRAVQLVTGLAESLRGRVVTLEAILLGLCRDSGAERVRAAVQPLVPYDRVVQTCFSAGNADPEGGLRSYFEALKNEVAPLVLWCPPTTGGSS